MMELPDQYKWLLDEPGPKMLVEILKLYGQREGVGGEDNQVILNWAKELNITEYKHDTQAWCGLLMSIVAVRSGEKIPTDSLRALSWIVFGIRVKYALLGDILIFKRIRGGHLGLYVGENEKYYYVLGGNQSKIDPTDSVNVKKLLKINCADIRRPIYDTEPSNLRKIFFDSEDNVLYNDPVY